ncbi:hypothetical protein FA95DRAFT_1451539, partial [Auriscalpium vulgare]
SEYNDGKGIRYTLTFIPVLPPAKTGEKRRKNAKPQPINRVFYAHEYCGLLSLLACAFAAALGADHDDLPFSLNRDGDLQGTRYQVSYTIPRSNSKDIRVSSVADYEELVDQAKEKAKPEVKLTVCEAAVRTADDDEDDEDLPRSKNKTKGLSKEEIAQAEMIDNLRKRYLCSDKSCHFDVCYPDNENARHVHLTFQLLRLWSSAIVESSLTIL